jgi:hypothetical protein
VDEFAILSEIVARRVAFAFKPATPALSEEEIVMGKRLSDALSPYDATLPSGL